MYKCNKCGSSVEIVDRFCFSCGSYLGEPVKSDENGLVLNDAYNIETFIGTECSTVNEREHLSSKTKVVKKLILPLLKLINSPMSSISELSNDITLTKSMLYTFLAIVSLAALLTVFIMLKFFSLEIFLSEILNGTPIATNISNLTSVNISFSAIFLSVAAMSIIAIVLQFSSLYFVLAYFCRYAGKLLPIWNILLLSVILFTLGLTGAIIISAINITLCILTIFTTSIFTIIITFNGIANLEGLDKNKLPYLYSLSYVPIVISLYYYIILFLN